MSRRARILAPLLFVIPIWCLASEPLQAAVPGAQLWVSRFRGPTIDFAAANAVSPDGREVFVTGDSEVPKTDETDAVTVAYAATNGGELWAARYHVPDGRAQALRVLADPSGSTVYVNMLASYPTGSPSGYTAVLAYDATTGQARWERDIAGRTYMAMALSPDGESLVLAGGTPTGGSTIDLDAGTGTIEWTTDETGPYTFVGSVAFVPRTDLIVESRMESGSSAYDDFAVALNSEGSVVWSTKVGSSSIGSSPYVTAAPDGSAVLIVASDDTARTGLDFLTTDLDPASGAVRWSARYSGPRKTDQATAVVVNPSGSRVFVTGMSNGDYTTVAYRASDGRNLWVSSYDGAGATDRPRAIGLSRSGGRVFITGVSPTPGNQGPFATVAYSAATGSQVWASRYDDAHGHAGALALAVSPVNDHVFVTGSGSVGSPYDYITLAYAP